MKRMKQKMIRSLRWVICAPVFLLLGDTSLGKGTEDNDPVVARASVFERMYGTPGVTDSNLSKGITANAQSENNYQIPQNLVSGFSQEKSPRFSFTPTGDRHSSSFDYTDNRASFSISGEVGGELRTRTNVQSAKIGGLDLISSGKLHGQISGGANLGIPIDPQISARANGFSIGLGAHLRIK